MLSCFTIKYIADAVLNLNGELDSVPYFLHACTIGRLALGTLEHTLACNYLHVYPVEIIATISA